MRILIKGGCGFIGAQVAREASAPGHAVTTADLNRSPDVKLNIGNAGEVLKAAEGHDVVIHCAAVVGPGPSKADPILAVAVNVFGTANILEAARIHDIRVVCLSTATLYGYRPDLQPLQESEAPAPISHYDATKYEAEILCRSYRKDFELQVVCVRTGFVYGPGHSTGQYFVEAAMQGEAIRQDVGADGLCEFTRVKDLASGLVLAAEKDRLPKPVYNVTGGVSRTRREFAKAVREAIPGSRDRSRARY